MSDAAQRYKKEAERRCAGFRFFWTSNRDCGLGPGCMRTGDIIVVLYGGQTPFVLRPRGDAYLILGQAYVHSIMD